MDQETIEEQRQKLLEDRRDFVDDSLEDVDINSYTTRKTVAEGVLDMTILTRNATLLRDMLHNDGSKRMFYHFLIVVISMTLILQVSFLRLQMLLQILKLISFIGGKWNFALDFGKLEV